MRRWPSTTRRAGLSYAESVVWASSTDGCASFIWRISGSSPAPPSRSTIQHLVPTLPTPTTLRAASTRWKRSRRWPWSSERFARYPVEQRQHPLELVVARHVTDQRELVDEPAPAVDDSGELVDGLQVVVGLRARDGTIGEGLGVGAARGLDHRRDAVGVDGEVPRIERRHRREAPEKLGVAQGEAEHGLLAGRRRGSPWSGTRPRSSPPVASGPTPTAPAGSRRSR